MKLTARDRQRLQGVHLDLVLVVDRAAALTPVPFIITEGMRTKARQAELVKAGASRTMNGRHLTGHAVDIAAVVGTEIRWDFGLYLRIAYAVKRAAINEGVRVVWGAFWGCLNDTPSLPASIDDYTRRMHQQGRRPLIDGPHFELDRRSYPA